MPICVWPSVCRLELEFEFEVNPDSGQRLKNIERNSHSKRKGERTTANCSVVRKLGNTIPHKSQGDAALISLD